MPGTVLVSLASAKKAQILCSGSSQSSEEVGKGKRRGSSLRDSEEALSGDRG